MIISSHPVLTKEMKVLKERKADQEKLEDIKVMNYLKEKAVCNTSVFRFSQLPYNKRS